MIYKFVKWMVIECPMCGAIYAKHSKNPNSYGFHCKECNFYESFKKQERIKTMTHLTTIDMKQATNLARQLRAIKGEMRGCQNLTGR